MLSQWTDEGSLSDKPKYKSSVPTVYLCNIYIFQLSLIINTSNSGYALSSGNSSA